MEEALDRLQTVTWLPSLTLEEREGEKVAVFLWRNFNHIGELLVSVHQP